MNTVINTALFCALIVAMVGIQAIDDNSAEHEAARQELAQQRQQERFERAAQQVCGENASFRLTHKKGERTFQNQSASKFSSATSSHVSTVENKRLMLFCTSTT